MMCFSKATLFPQEVSAISRKALEMAAVATRSFQKQMGPKDALESLAPTVALMAHGRVAWLTKLATSQTDVPSVVAVNEACDRSCQGS